MSSNDNRNQIWGSRFSSNTQQIMEQINASIDFDKRLYRQDIAGSRAHVRMLEKQKLISSEDSQTILNGLDLILKELESGVFKFSRQLEDIHMNIEARLFELIGPVAGRLHTARSRNDQVATDFRLWTKETSMNNIIQLRDLITTLLDKAEQHTDSIMPGFTHLQSAQPVTFGHHCMAYVEMFSRDLSRFEDAITRMDECPLGAAALAGTSYNIDRFSTCKALEFREPTRNSIDSVSDRDFSLDYLSASAICAMHLSRLAEEIIIWVTPQFNFIRLSDKFSTGSSIMPQKRNPDAAELIRAKTGRINGSLNALLTVLKGLPLAYSKDMQEDKEIVFDCADSLSLCLDTMRFMIKDMVINCKVMAKAAGAAYATATDLADWLVREIGITFRKAHHITGAAVKLAEEKKCELCELSLAEFQSIEPAITNGVFKVLSVTNSVAGRTSFGGTSPDNIRKQISYWRKRI